MHIALFGGFDVGIALGGQEEQPVVVYAVLEGLDGSVPRDDEGVFHVRKNDHLAEGNKRQLVVECNGIVSLQGNHGRHFRRRFVWKVRGVGSGKVR